MFAARRKAGEVVEVVAVADSRFATAEHPNIRPIAALLVEDRGDDTIVYAHVVGGEGRSRAHHFLDRQQRVCPLIDDASLGDFSPNEDDFNQKVWEARDGVRQALRDRLGDEWPLVMDKIRAVLPRDGIFVRDQTISAYNWGNQLFPIYEPRTSMSPTSGAIGPGFPMAIGIAIATGKKTVVIHGDGGFLYHATELATAAQYRVPVVVCVFNDQGYGVLRWLQDTRFGRINETDLGKMDFAMLAESLGVPGERVQSVEEFGRAIEKGMAASGPYLIDVDMEHFAPMAISMMPKKK